VNPLLRASLPLLLLALAPGALAADPLGDRSFEVRGPATEQVWVVESPALSGDQYAITGSVAYDQVEGDAFLEMWSVFPDGSRYFSRTLDEQGPMAKLRGSSPARPFVLPFFLTPDSPRPLRLELNVVLPAGGRVVLRELRLGSGGAATAAPGAWWSDQTAGWIGGAAGSAVGLLGAAIGTLCTLGRGRRFVMAGLLALGVSGLALLAVGLVALALGQPYAVWYPLVLMGVLDPVLAFSLLPTARRRFEEIELRRMQALDAR
jgi:hypothetical protein